MLIGFMNRVNMVGAYLLPYLVGRLEDFKISIWV